MAQKKRTKRVIVALRLNGATGREELEGIFDFLDLDPGWDIRVAQVSEDLDAALCSPMLPDGVIVGLLHSPQTLRLLAESTVPTVAIGIGADRLAPRKKKLAFLQIDDEYIGHLAADYFQSLGQFRSFGFVPALERNSFPPSERPWSRRRQLAFCNRLPSKGRKLHVFSGDSSNTKSLANWLLGLPKPSGVFVSWDGIAPMVLDAIHLTNLKVPAQLSLLSVDNDRFICDSMYPSLSSISPDYARLGYMAAETLNRLMQGKHLRNSFVRGPVRGVVERESTSPVAPAVSLILRANTFIHDHATQPITPNDIANNLGVSRRLLDLRFHEFANMSPAEVILEARLDEVKRRLSHSHVSITKIATNLGFENVRSLMNVFKKHVGTTMTQWRQTMCP